MFGMTAGEWRKANPESKGNILDYASINQLICLSNMENLNAVFISDGLPQAVRLEKLREQNRYTQVQLASLLGISRQALIKYESLEQEPSVSTVRALASIFKVDYSCIIDNKLAVTSSEKEKNNLCS